MKPYATILQSARTQVWAMRPENLAAFMAMLRMKAMGETTDTKAIADLAGVSAPKAATLTLGASGTVAVLPLYGMISRTYSWWGTSTVRFAQQFRQAVDDASVKAIVIDIDSPGGSVEGVDELATEIRAARGKKKIIGVSSGLCASAAYYIASACTEVVASPSSLTGSVGVYCIHEDDSEYLQKLGIKFSLIKFGENKAAGIFFEPLSESARADMQAMVDEFGEMFEMAVAKGRKIAQDKVHGSFGQGKVFSAKDAKRIGMVDTVATLDEVLGRFGISPSTTALRSTQIVVAGDVDGDCDCPCAGCQGGDCDACDCEGCDATNCGNDDCDCGGASAKASLKAHHGHLMRQIEIAEA